MATITAGARTSPPWWPAGPRPGAPRRPACRKRRLRRAGSTRVAAAGLACRPTGTAGATAQERAPEQVEEAPRGGELSSPNTPESIGRRTVSMARSERPAARSSWWVVRSERCLSRPAGPTASNADSRARADASRSDSSRSAAPATAGSGPTGARTGLEHAEPAVERAQVQRRRRRTHGPAPGRPDRRAWKPRSSQESVDADRYAVGRRPRRPPPALDVEACTYQCRAAASPARPAPTTMASTGPPCPR